MSETTALTIWEEKTPVTQAVDRLWSYLPAIAAPGYNLDSFSARLAVQVMKQPNIVHAKRETVISCLTEVAELGLILGSECNLVVYGQDPKKMECSNLIEFQAWMRKFREIPGVDDVITEVVYSNDHFKYDRVNRKIEHVVDDMNPNRGTLTHAYAIVYWLDPRKKPIIEVLNKQAVDRHRARARGSGNTPAWNNNEPEMWRKSAMQALARRYGRSLSGVIGGMAERDERTEYLEHRHTAPDHNIVEGYKDDLFGDRPNQSDSRTLDEQFDDHVNDLHDGRPSMSPQTVVRPEPVNVDTVTGEVIEEVSEFISSEAKEEPVESQDASATGNSPDLTQAANDAFEARQLRMAIKPRLLRPDGKPLTPSQIATFVKSCGGDDTPFDLITDVKILQEMDRRIKAKEPHQKNLLQEDSA